MTQGKPHAIQDPSDESRSSGRTDVEHPIDVGSRAVDRFTELYVETEHERRSTRYDRAITKARKE